MANPSDADRELLSAIHALMREYGVSRLQLLKMLGYRPARATSTGPIPHTLLTYRNPHTGASIRVRSHQSRAYRAWVAEFGEDVVATWMVAPNGSPAADR